MMAIIVAKVLGYTAERFDFEIRALRLEGNGLFSTSSRRTASVFPLDKIIGVTFFISPYSPARLPGRLASRLAAASFFIFPSPAFTAERPALLPAARYHFFGSKPSGGGIRRADSPASASTKKPLSYA
jgi:hypothetical protein